MKQIITASEFATFRSISVKLDEKKINECIALAEQNDLLSTLGNFYFDVLANLDNEVYFPLLNGSDFEVDGESFAHFGIKALLADYVYSRYIMMVNINLTPFGAVTKTVNESQSTDRATLKELQKQAQIDAGLKFTFVKMYIEANADLFPRFGNCEKKSVTPYNTVKATTLRKRKRW